MAARRERLRRLALIATSGLRLLQNVDHLIRRRATSRGMMIVFFRPAVHASVQDGCLLLCAEVSFEPFEQYDDYSACFGAQICALSRNPQRHDLFFRVT